MVQTWVEAVCKASQGIGFTHARSCSENTYAPDILEVIETVRHLVEILGYKAVLFFELLFVKGIV